MHLHILWFLDEDIFDVVIYLANIGISFEKKIDA
jgi:hypothetical protein